MNIRKVWMAILIVLSLGFLISAASAQIVSIADGSADAGATTTVTITADDVTDLANFDITVTYDPAVVIVTGAANDGAFGSSVNNLESAASGSVRLASFNFGAGQTGDGVLLSTLTLEAVGTAGQTSALTLTVNELKTSSEVDIAATTDGGVFTVTGEAPVVPVVSISDGSAGAGATTTVTITADDVTDLANFDITVTYDPAVVIVTGAANDGAFGVAVNNLESAASGSVRLASLNFGAGQTGDGIVLSTLTLEAVGDADQTSTLTLTINELKTSSEVDIAATTDGGVFTVTGEAPVVPVVSISDGSADAGATTTVTITADDVTDLANFDITVAYDPDVVNVTGAANDAAFGVAVNNLESAASGSVRLVSLNIGDGQTGDGILISTLTLEAVGTAGQTSALTLTINELKTSSEVAIAATTDGGVFTVGAAAEPPTVTYTISDTTITPPQTTSIDVRFSERVSAIIKIEDASGNLVNELYTSSGVTDPSAKIWDGTYTNGTTVPADTYTVNVSGVNTTTGLSVVDTSETIEVVTEAVTVSIGSADDVSGTVAVPISIAGASNIGAMDLTVTYDASILAATDVANGTMTEGLSNFTSAYDISEGKLNISFATYPDMINGDGELFVVTFAAAGVGNSALVITVTEAWTGDVTPQPVTVTVENGSVTVTESIYPMIGDMDGSSVVTFDDVVLLARHFYFEDEVHDDPDVDSSGEVTFDDVVLLARHFYFGDTLYPQDI